MPKIIGSYELGNVTLGEGKFGKVKSAVNASTGERVAIKIIDKSRMQTGADDAELVKEIRIMQAVQHPHVLRLIDVISDDAKLYLVIELAPNGDLFDKIIEMKRFPEPDAKFFFGQILSGLSYCHKMGIVHRDLKPENLLLGENEEIKICDFGLSNFWITEDGPRLLYTAVGTPHYAAPEVMAGRTPYDGRAIDVWSTGVILYVMTVGQFPFEEPSSRCKLFRTLEAGTFQWPTKAISSELVDLLQGMMCCDVTRRITIDGIRKHAWMRGVFTADGDVAPMSAYSATEVTVAGGESVELMDMDDDDGLAARDVNAVGPVVEDAYVVHRANIVRATADARRATTAAATKDLRADVPMELALQRCTAFYNLCGLSSADASDAVGRVEDPLLAASFNRDGQPAVELRSVCAALFAEDAAAAAGSAMAAATRTPELVPVGTSQATCITTDLPCDTDGARRALARIVAAVVTTGGSVTKLSAKKWRVRARVAGEGGRVEVDVHVFSVPETGKAVINVRKVRGDVLSFHAAFRSVAAMF
jgi:hypothetical protein